MTINGAHHWDNLESHLKSSEGAGASRGGARKRIGEFCQKASNQFVEMAAKASFLLPNRSYIWT